MVDLDKLGEKLGSLSRGFGHGMRSLFGSRNERILKGYRATVEQVNQLASWAEELDQEAMVAQTREWQERFAGEGGDLEEILPEAFALVREASVRTLGLRHFDVQILGGAVLHRGGIAEMATGEGKTLAATLPAYLNALRGRGVFVVTVNDYLAQRDRDWMAPIYEYLGLTTGAIQSSMLPADRHPQYACDITFGTNNEFGFDYLRDNMKVRADDQVQKHLHFAIIDEVDSILVDEARTPLIISGPPEGDAERYRVGDRVVARLRAGDHFEIKEKEKQALLTESGIEACEKSLGVDDFYTGAGMDWPHILESCLRARHLYVRDKDYVVQDGEIVIVDEFTGRMMPGRRWSDGLHQAVEAKEGIRPKAENQTLATITFQNYFRMFDKLAGMTGTALTEAAEFAKIYDLDVVQIPTNRPIARDDANDIIYRTGPEKWRAVAAEIEELQSKGQPVLVGTTSIETSELVSGMLARRGVKHEVLNAKNHEREAQIVVQAGRKGAVTVATNMAGRGTDIVLGGNLEGLTTAEMHSRGLDPEDETAFASVRAELEPAAAEEKKAVLAAGGLYVLGTERHEARRIDNQLRGRSGRQGDPGVSRFFLSLDDDLMRIFYRDWVKNFLGKVGMKEDEPIESGMVSRAIEKAQKKVEERNFEVRKSLLEYDEVMDKQRRLIYEMRNDVLVGSDEIRDRIREMFEEVTRTAVERYHGDGKDEPDDLDGLALWAERKLNWAGVAADLQGGPAASSQLLLDHVAAAYAAKVAEEGEESMAHLERYLLLNAIDSKWKEHLFVMDSLKSGVGLRGYAQVDPKAEYKKEGLARFQEMLTAVADEVAGLILKVRIRREDDERLGRAYAKQDARHPSVTGGPVGRAAPPTGPSVAVGYNRPGDTPDTMERARQAQEQASLPQGARPAERAAPKTPRNAPCPCGSGRKYKQCCGRNA